MKSLLLMILVVATVLGAAASALTTFGARINAIDPLAAGAIAAAAGLMGLVPILVGRRRDPVGIFQLALVGTVLHLLTAIASTAAAVAIHLVAVRMPFMSWLLVGYWTSLIALVWQLRRLLLRAAGIGRNGTTA